MSPEQAASGHGLTTASDVYSLGAILYRLLTGRPPFRGDSVMETLHHVRERVPDRPRSFDPTLQRDLETICLKCLEKLPERRYRSANALAEDLERWSRRAHRGPPRWGASSGRRSGAAATSCSPDSAQATVAASIVGFAAVCIEWRRAEANYRDATTQRALAQQNLAGEQAANDKLRQANAQVSEANAKLRAAIRARRLRGNLPGRGVWQWMRSSGSMPGRVATYCSRSLASSRCGSYY